MDINSFMELIKDETQELMPCRNGRSNRPSCNYYHYKLTYKGTHIVYFLTLKQIHKTTNIPPSSVRKIINNMNIPKWKKYKIEKVRVKVEDINED